MKPCEVCGESHHLHSENDLSNCLVWANDENRKLKAEVERLKNAVETAYKEGWEQGLGRGQDWTGVGKNTKNNDWLDSYAFDVLVETEEE